VDGDGGYESGWWGGGRWWWRTWRVLEVTERKRAESALEARSTMRGKVWFPVKPHASSGFVKHRLHTVSVGNICKTKPGRKGVSYA